MIKKAKAKNIANIVICSNVCNSAACDHAKAHLESKYCSWSPSRTAIKSCPECRRATTEEMLEI
jgi:hypothetical protein